MGDVYARMAARMAATARSAGAGLGGWAFGDVLEAGQGRLRVVCGGLTLGADELHVPPELDYAWTEDEGQDGLLRPGDRLLVLVTADRQDYYVLERAPW